jgi:probable rRNA maturation factor
MTASTTTSSPTSPAPTSQDLDISFSLEAGDWEAVVTDVEQLVEAAARTAFEAAERPEILGDAPAEMSLVLADDALVQTLNRDYRDKDKPTNVLSFALLDDLDDTDDVLAREQGMPILIGDVILAFETVQREAREQGKSVGDHLTHLVIHGVLHLLGYDHQSDPDADRMERLETSILARMGIADPYSANPAKSAGAEGETGADGATTLQPT